MNTTERIFRFNSEHDLYFEIINQVQKPIARNVALAAYKQVSAMSEKCGSWITFTVGSKS